MSAKVGSDFTFVTKIDPKNFAAKIAELQIPKETLKWNPWEPIKYADLIKPRTTAELEEALGLAPKKAPASEGGNNFGAGPDDNPFEY
jgi:hypothetical protein